jgi:hypothetical protein
MSASRSVFRRLQAIVVTTFGLSLAVGMPPVLSGAAVDPPAGLDPVDAQAWVDQGELTWADYTPVPGQPAGWRDGSIRGSQDDYLGAAVLLDFTDQPFLTTQAPESHPFGNPQPGWSPIARTEVAQWMENYLNTPNQYNGGQSITGYWMEDSFGRISVDMTAFGPYMLPGKVHEYGLADFAPVTGLESRCPLGDVCNKAIRTDGLALWRANEGPTIDTQFDVIFYVTAGHDESSTWQEFGEMMFQTQNDVPAAFGPPGAGGASPCRTGHPPATSPGPRGARPATTGRTPAETPLPRQRARGRACTLTSSATSAACPTTTTTRSLTTSEREPPTGR